MKKLIVLSVIFALVATTAAFAVDLGAAVFGLVTPVQGESGTVPYGKDAGKDASDKVTSSAGFERVRFDGGGETDDGQFGGWIRMDNGNLAGKYAFWKPIDQLKVLIGGNPDGFYGKEGVTGWGFHQMPYDGGVAFGGSNIWGWGPYSGDSGENNAYGLPFITRDVFYGGEGGDALHLNITPVEMFGINIVLPFFKGGEAVEVFKQVTVQLDVKLDFGNIALTYVGGRGYKEDKVIKDKVVSTLNTPDGSTLIKGPKYPDPTDPTGEKKKQDDYYFDPAGNGGLGSWIKVTGEPGKDAEVEKGYDESPGKIFLYYGGSFGDLGIDFGFSYKFAKDDGKPYPLGIGLGVKFAQDWGGVKLRTIALLGGDKENTMMSDNTYILAELLPYFSLGDNIAAFLGLGISMYMPGSTAKDLADAAGLEAKTITDFYVNPYVRIGEEWGAQFLVGVKLWTEGGTENGKLSWSVPVAIMVSF